jgi:hypothetical protein
MFCISGYFVTMTRTPFLTTELTVIVNFIVNYITDVSRIYRLMRE